MLTTDQGYNPYCLKLLLEIVLWEWIPNKTKFL